MGGFLYSRIDLKLNVLFFGALILLVSLFYDDLRFSIITTHRRYKQQKSTN